jgi:uncharacterized protein
VAAAAARTVCALVIAGLAAAQGLPRLTDEADRAAFTGWFTFLAEVQAYLAPPERPAEITDCAALLRFAYREALAEHTGAWAGRLRLPATPALPPVTHFRIPRTSRGLALFRVPGGGFAEFADAGTLMRWNTTFVSRDLKRAAPGDLLFFRQLGQNLPFHAMIWIGRSHFENGAGLFLVYHTGPLAGTAGEIRRVSVDALLRHPEPRWRPVAGNANFLGVFRWNLLRDTI